MEIVAVGVAAVAGQVCRRRRTRQPRPNEECPGRDSAACSWSTSQLEQPARTQPARGLTHCLFCGDAQLDKILAQHNGFQLTKTLKALRELDDAKYEAALENLKSRRGEAFAADFGSRVDLTIYRAVERQRAPRKSVPERWSDLLQRRARAQGPLDGDALATYEKAVRRDRMMMRRKVFARDCARKRYSKANEEAELARMPLPPADVAPNDSSLPGATLSARARMAEAWCKHGSWQICEGCGSVRPRPLQPVDLRSIRQPTIKKCLLCRRGVYVPQPDDIPEPLRSLPDKALEALRPLEVDSGPFERAEHGYQVHTTMIRFAWAAESVGAKIRALETHDLRSRARKAFRFLAESDESAYGEFIDEHEEFLKKHRGASEQVRKRPLRFIEKQGLENAVWPHLYWHKNLCETVVRATDERRRVRTGLSEEEVSGAGSEVEDGPALTKGRHSVRRSWMTKVFSPVAGYSEDFQLLHFVYDLVLWTNLGGCKNATRGMPLRLAVKGSPEYWRVRHQALIDMQRQAGAPTLFRTRAPYKRSFPYHQWVLHEMALAGRSRLNLAGPETLHMAHVLKEMDRGFFAGKNHKGWRDHLLGAEGEEGNCEERSNTVVNFCS